MRFVLFSILAAGCTPPGAGTQVFDLTSTSERVCSPPSETPARTLSVVGDEPVTLTGALFEEVEADGRSNRGPAFEREGIPVALWHFGDSTGAGYEELLVVETDADGRFTMALDPALLLPDRSLGFLVGGKEQWLLTEHVEPLESGNQVLCAYWAWPDGVQVQTTAPAVGEEVALVAHGMGDLAPPYLVVREVGVDSSDDVVLATEGAPFVDGVSTTLWTIDAEDGFLSGPGVELQFSAGAWSADDEDDQSAVVSGWLYTQ